MTAWKLYYETQTVEGRSREEWDAAPVVGVQVLAKKLDEREAGKSRVVWYEDERNRRLFHDCHFYLWQEDGPSGVTPDALLDAWALRTNDTSARVGDLSLDDMHAIGAKCGRSLPNERFKAILERAINDTDIP